MRCLNRENPEKLSFFKIDERDDVESFSWLNTVIISVREAGVIGQELIE